MSDFNDKDAEVTYVIVVALTTDVKKSVGEVEACHVEGVIDSPKSGHEAVTETGESTTRRGVGFEHDERLVHLGRNLRGVGVWLRKFDDGRVVEEELGHLLFGVKGAGVVTVVRGITEESRLVKIGTS